MKRFIDKICSYVFYDKSKVKGYSIEEVEKIERLYNCYITGDFRDFLVCMGRCDGGLIGADIPLIFYMSKWKVADHMDLQFTFNVRCRIVIILFMEKVFLSIEYETQYFFIKTRPKNKNDYGLVFQFDDNSGEVCKTKWDFIEYLRYVVDTHGKNHQKAFPRSIGKMILSSEMIII